MPRPADIRPRAAIARLIFLCAVLGSALAARSIFNPLIDMVKADLAVDDVAISLAQGIALSLPAALVSILVGRFIDSRNRTRLLLILATLAMAGSIATAFATSVADLLLSRALAGLGILEEAVVLSLVADLFPPEQRGRANVIIVVGEYGGLALGFALVGWLLPLADMIPWLSSVGAWRVVPMLFGMFGLLFALPLLWLDEPPRQEQSKNASPNFIDGFRALRRYRSLLGPLLVAQIALAASGNMSGIWAVPAFIRNYGLSPSIGGDLVALIMLAAPLLGAVLAGVTIDRLKAERGAILVAVYASLLALPGAFFPLAPDSESSAALLATLTFCHTAAALSSTTLGILAIPNELRGLWAGVCTLLIILVSYTVAPTLVAALATAMGSPKNVSEALATLLLLTAIAATLGFICARRAIERGRYFAAPAPPRSSPRANH